MKTKFLMTLVHWLVLLILNLSWHSHADVNKNNTDEQKSRSICSHSSQVKSAYDANRLISENRSDLERELLRKIDSFVDSKYDVLDKKGLLASIKDIVTKVYHPNITNQYTVTGAHFIYDVSTYRWETPDRLTLWPDPATSFGTDAERTHAEAVKYCGDKKRLPSPKEFEQLRTYFGYDANNYQVPKFFSKLLSDNSYALKQPTCFWTSVPYLAYNSLNGHLIEHNSTSICRFFCL